METLTAVFNRLKQLEATATTGSNFSRLTEIASFMDDLADITQQMEQVVTEAEKNKDEQNRFYDYFKDLYGTGLEVANWHQNGDTEPFDNFFDSAEEGA